jgi:DNA polymerase III alpha subunit
MTNEIKGRTIQSDGSVINDQSTLCEILYNDRDIGGCFNNDSDEIKRFHLANKLCDTEIPEPSFTQDLPYKNIRWQDHWFTPESYINLDLQEWCMAKCTSNEEKSRVIYEIAEFEKRQMIPAIKHMMYCADTWRKNNVVWGVGRGSSVSSFVLYLIGINRINPLKYNLDLLEWLK